MSLSEEIIVDTSRTLIISDPGNPLAHAVTQYHAHQGAQVVSATHIPPRVGNHIHRCYCFTNIKFLAEDAASLAQVPEVILIASIDRALRKKDIATIELITKHSPHIKIALIPKGEYHLPLIVERLMHFSFDQNLHYAVLASTPIESLHTSNRNANHKPKTQPKVRSFKDWYISLVSKPMRTIAALLLMVIIAHAAFIAPLAFSGATIFLQATKQVQAMHSPTKDPFAYARISLEVAKRAYQPVRKGWLFLGLAPYPEGLMEVFGSIIRLYDSSQAVQNDTSIMLAKMLDSQTIAQDQILEKRIALERSFRSMQTDIRIILSKTPKIALSLYGADQTLTRLDEYLGYALQGLSSFDTLFAKDDEKLYALFFANDRELRPGGGFIGSFALIRIRNLQVQEWKTYDVYDADGQLKARVAPPKAISEHLKQPFFFLRDSAFSPDHPSNMLLAEDFLQKELGIAGIDGAALITFASIEALIRDIGPIYISEFQDTIGFETAYIKTQLYAEQDSFAGSIQKKDFIQALASELFIRISEPKTALRALESIRESLDSKNIALYVRDTPVQELFDTLYWSGRQLPPGCVTQNVPRTTVCVPLYVFPVEANLGVNKANSFVSRKYAYTIRVSTDGTVTSELVTTFHNMSYPDTYPGGPYKNYYQLYLPPDSAIQSMAIDDIIPTSPDVEKDKYTRIGLWFEIPEQSRRKVTVAYRSAQKLTPGDSQIQLIFQKQMGVPSSKLTVKLDIPETFHVRETNFSPLAEEGVVEYNSTIDSDKLYYIHF